MGKLRQKEKQEWIDRNSSEIHPPNHHHWSFFFYDCCDLRRSHIRHCCYSFLLRWPGNFEPGISFRSVVLRGHNHVSPKWKQMVLIWLNGVTTTPSTPPTPKHPCHQSLCQSCVTLHYTYVYAHSESKNIHCLKSSHLKSEEQSGRHTEKAMKTHTC